MFQIFKIVEVFWQDFQNAFKGHIWSQIFAGIKAVSDKKRFLKIIVFSKFSLEWDGFELFLTLNSYGNQHKYHKNVKWKFTESPFSGKIFL